MESELEKVAWFQYFALLLIKKKKSYKQQKIGGFEYFWDSDVVNKLFYCIVYILNVDADATPRTSCFWKIGKCIIMGQDSEEVDLFPFNAI